VNEHRLEQIIHAQRAVLTYAKINWDAAQEENLKLREKIVALREENLALRETIFELRQELEAIGINYLLLPPAPIEHPLLPFIEEVSTR
jgi:hypothetical protein